MSYVLNRNVAFLDLIMFIILAQSILIALAVAAAIILLALGLSRSFRMNVLHWLAVILCVAISTVFLFIAIGSGKAANAVNSIASGAKDVTALADQYQEYIQYIPGTDMLPSITDTADQYIDNVSTKIVRKLRKTTIWMVIVVVVINLLLLLLLLNSAGKSKPRSKSYDSTDDFDRDIDIGLDSSFDADVDL